MLTQMDVHLFAPWRVLWGALIVAATVALSGCSNDVIDRRASDSIIGSEKREASSAGEATDSFNSETETLREDLRAIDPELISGAYLVRDAHLFCAKLELADVATKEVGCILVNKTTGLPLPNNDAVRLAILKADWEVIDATGEVFQTEDLTISADKDGFHVVIGLPETAVDASVQVGMKIESAKAGAKESAGKKSGKKKSGKKKSNEDHRKEADDKKSDDKKSDDKKAAKEDDRTESKDEKSHKDEKKSDEQRSASGRGEDQETSHENGKKNDNKKNDNKKNEKKGQGKTQGDNGAAKSSSTLAEASSIEPVSDVLKVPSTDGSAGDKKPTIAERHREMTEKFEESWKKHKKPKGGR